MLIIGLSAKVGTTAGILNVKSIGAEVLVPEVVTPSPVFTINPCGNFISTVVPGFVEAIVISTLFPTICTPVTVAFVAPILPIKPLSIEGVTPLCCPFNGIVILV